MSGKLQSHVGHMHDDYITLVLFLCISISKQYKLYDIRYSSTVQAVSAGGA